MGQEPTGGSSQLSSMEGHVGPGGGSREVCSPSRREGVGAHGVSNQAVTGDDLCMLVKRHSPVERGFARWVPHTKEQAQLRAATPGGPFSPPGTSGGTSPSESRRGAFQILSHRVRAPTKGI